MANHEYKIEVIGKAEYIADINEMMEATKALVEQLEKAKELQEIISDPK